MRLALLVMAVEQLIKENSHLDSQLDQTHELTGLSQHIKKR